MSGSISGSVDQDGPAMAIFIAPLPAKRKHLMATVAGRGARSR